MRRSAPATTAPPAAGGAGRGEQAQVDRVGDADGGVATREQEAEVRQRAAATALAEQPAADGADTPAFRAIAGDDEE